MTPEMCLVTKYPVKFPHSPILHYVFSSWVKKRKKENNNKNNSLPLGKQICFTIVWGCMEILPNILVLEFQLHKHLLISLAWSDLC